MFKKALIASAMLVSVIGANAAETAAFGVTGGATPATCGISFSGNGSFDFGTLTRAQMNALPSGVAASGAAFYDFGSKTNTLTVSCGAAIKANLSFTDNHAGKTIPYNGGDPYRFGMVDGAGSTAIASIDVDFSGTLIDGLAPAGTLTAANGTSAWSSTYGFLNRANPGYTTGFIKTAGETTPSTYTTLTTNLILHVYASKSYMDSATNAVTFNGGGVITLTYL